MENGIITSAFGERINPISNKKKFHDGIDISAEKGSYVLAVKDATVLDVFTSKTYGNCIKYITDDGYKITYAHLEKSLVKKNEKIEMGQKIGIIGNTGLSTGVHLHYIIEKNDELINPIFYVNLPYSDQFKKDLGI